MLADKRIWKAISLLLPTAGMLALYAYIATFSRLIGDDYCLLYYADRFGLLRSIWYWYLNFEGIFSGNIADYFLIFFGEKWMGVVLPACLVILMGSAAFSFAALLDRSYRGIQKTLAAFALGCGLVVSMFILSPHLPQSYYWWAGTRKYVLPLIFISLYPGLYLKFMHRDWGKRRTTFWYLISFALLFFIGGFSETLNPGLTVALLFVLGMKLLVNKFDFSDKTFLFLLFGFAGFVIAFAIMALAPGNSVRQDYFSGPPDLLTALKVALMSYIGFLGFIPGSWILSFVFLGVVLGTMNLGIGDVENTPPNLWSFALTLLATFVVPWACFLPFAYVVGEPLVPRAMIDPAYLFVAFLMYCALLGGRLLSSKIRFVHHLAVQGVLAVFVFASLSFSLWQAGQNFYALGQAHMEYASEWDRIQIEIERAVQDGRESLAIPPKGNWGGILDINDNPRFYVNQCVSKFYQLDIRVDESLEIPK